PRHIYVIPVANGKREPRRIVKSAGYAGQLEWSPDGKSIVYVHSKSSATNDWSTSDVMLEGEREKLLQMEANLRRRVIGQEEAIVAVSNAIRRARAGLQDPNRPIGS